MSASIQGRVRDLLREAGPLTAEEILDRLSPLPSKNPKQSIRNALTSSQTCYSTGDGRYCYLPTFVRSAAVRVLLRVAAPERGQIVAGVEVLALLWPGDVWEQGDHRPNLRLAGGPTVAIGRPTTGFAWSSLRSPLALPAPFWDWWADQHSGGADALLLRCEDGERGEFTVAAIRDADLDDAAVEAGNEALRAATANFLKRTRGLRGYELAPRVLATGLYHGPVAPDPLQQVLLEQDGPFFLDRGVLTYRPEITPAFRRVLAPRLAAEGQFEEELLASGLEGREEESLPPGLLSPFAPLWEDGDDSEDDEATPARLIPPARQAYRLKVSLDWDKRVWRAIEILDNQSLTDLHYAIQRAFNWDDDHLYAFFLSGKAWDSLTEVACPLDDTVEPPTTDEVLIGDLDLVMGQRLLYLFDYGDDLRHQIEVLGSVPAPPGGDFPRIIESRGVAPPQYPDLDEWGDEEDGADDEG